MSNASPLVSFVQEGETINYTPGADVAAGDVIVISNRMLGIALRPINSGVLGALCVEGVFSFPLHSGDQPALGDPLYWDATNSEATTSAGATAGANTLIGPCTKAFATGDTVIEVKLNEALSQAVGSVGGVVAGYRLARGVSAVTGTLDLTTGLNTVVALVACLAEDASASGFEVSYTPQTQSGGTAGHATLKVWMQTDTTHPTPIASNVAKNVAWIAIGT